MKRVDDDYWHSKDSRSWIWTIVAQVHAFSLMRDQQKWRSRQSMSDWHHKSWLWTYNDDIRGTIEENGGNGH